MIVHVSSIQDYSTFISLLAFDPARDTSKTSFLFTGYTVHNSTLEQTQSVEKTLKSCVYCVHWNLCTEVHTQDKYS